MRAAQNGGAIRNEGSLEVTGSFFGNNTAEGDGEAIYNEASSYFSVSASIRNSSFEKGNAIYEDDDKFIHTLVEHLDSLEAREQLVDVQERMQAYQTSLVSPAAPRTPKIKNFGFF